LERLEERCLLNYSITDLGTLPGDAKSSAYGINASGQVVGGSTSSEGWVHAFFWDNSNGMEDLGTLGGPYSSASGINDAGQVVGYAYLPDYYFHAFHWDSSSGMQDLGTLGDKYSVASGINDSGQVVGLSYPLSQPFHAFLWESATGMQALGTLGGLDSEAYGINGSGEVVGFSTTAAGFGHAFLWDSSNGMQDLGTPAGGDMSIGLGINASGQVVGTWYLSGEQFFHAFLWDSTNGMQDLGTLPGLPSTEALGINDAGQVVGISSDEPNTHHAFLWDSANGMQDLNALVPPDASWTLLQQATAINDAGQIVGEGINPDGQEHAFLLTPDDSGASHGRRKPAAVIDPAVIQVLTPFGSHDTPGIFDSVSLFEKAPAGPVSQGQVAAIERVPMARPPAGWMPLAASTQRQAHDVLFAARDLAQTSGHWRDWEFDLVALELFPPR
jgi:probable HAF family extracellular repeat protein